VLARKGNIKTQEKKEKVFHRTLRGYYWQQRNDGQLGAEDDAESFD
jgi:hypothetical protein